MSLLAQTHPSTGPYTRTAQVDVELLEHASPKEDRCLRRQRLWNNFSRAAATTIAISVAGVALVWGMRLNTLQAKKVGFDVRHALQLSSDDKDPFEWMDTLREQLPGLAARLDSPNITEDEEGLRRVGFTDPKFIRMLTSQQPATVRQMKAAAVPNIGAIPTAYPQTKEMRTAKCVLHVGQAALYFAEAGNNIAAATRDCGVIKKGRFAGHHKAIAVAGHHRGQDAKLTCAVDIEAVIVSFGWAAFFLADAANYCGKESTVKMSCASNSIAMATALFGLAHAATGIPLDCPGQTVFDVAKSKMHKPKPVNTSAPEALTFCILEPIHASYWLARAGMIIQNAVIACHYMGQQACAMKVLDVISAFGFVAAFLASAVSDCQAIINTRALCAADLIGLISALSTTAAEGMAVHAACDESKNEEAEGALAIHNTGH